jgi:ABC-type oligopeptide transport system ATPase subunit
VRLLEDVGLRPAKQYLDRYPHELSGGQRQRVSIARSLAMEPKLIIADEPLSGADVSIRGQVLNLLLDIQRSRDVAYLMITHDISIARAFADRVAVMMKGELVEVGPADAVLTTPEHPYTRRLVAAVPALGSLRPPPAARPPA